MQKNAPNARLNYFWFNDDLRLQRGYSGSIQMPQNVNGIGSVAMLGNGLQTLPTGTTPRNGGDYYIDNQTIGQEVWFNDLFVTNYKSEVMEEDHY